MNSVGKFWAQVPVYILRDHRHRAGHLRVLGAILSCPAPHFPSLNEIATRSGHQPKYCSNMISEMVKFGTLEREQRYNSTNVYRLTGFSEESTTDVDTESTSVVELKEPLKEGNTSSKGTSNDTTSFGTSNGRTSLKGFGYFCQVYPKHRLGSVAKLRDLWITCDLEPFSKEITDSVKSFRSSPDWKNENGKYVVGAVRFLEEERWRTYANEPQDPLSSYSED